MVLLDVCICIPALLDALKGLVDGFDSELKYVFIVEGVGFKVVWDVQIGQHMYAPWLVEGRGLGRLGRGEIVISKVISTLGY